MQKGIVKLKQYPSIISAASIVGKCENEGPLGYCFDIHDNTDKFGQDTWERAESEIQRMALNLSLSKVKLRPSDIDALFAGDLINQCTSSAYGLLEFDIPFFGLYGACSTAIEAITLGALLVDSGIYKRSAAVTSSHNCSAERQFRYPLEYGGQRSPTSQWTVTGGAAFIIEASSDNNGPFISEVLTGRTVDKGITDANNMGAAMAPAAVDTLVRYFKESKRSPESFDMILTGDLGFEGFSIFNELILAEGYNIKNNYNDCGLMVYDRKRQDTHSGASGCGCSAIVLSGYVIGQFKKHNIKDILFIGTGALMSPLSVQQGQSIPGVAHLIRLTGEKNI